MDYYLKTRKFTDPASETKFKADIMDKGEYFLIRCELAGYAKDEIDIMATKDKITITAKKNTECGCDEGKYLHRETVCSQKSRTFYIGDIDINKITAEYSDGLLSLELPKTDCCKGKKIEL